MKFLNIEYCFQNIFSQFQGNEDISLSKLEIEKPDYPMKHLLWLKDSRLLTIDEKNTISVSQLI